MDASVFLYEYIKHMDLIFHQKSNQLTSSAEFKMLENVRNNVHTFSKNGKFAQKAKKIIDNKLEEFNMKEHDDLYDFRNDISLIFEINGHTRQLIGVDYFIKHCLLECDVENWESTDYKNFGEYVSSKIKYFATNVNPQTYKLNILNTNTLQPQVELFNYKSEDLFTNSGLSNATTFRLMLILFEISYGMMLVEKILSQKSYKDDDLWVCFFSKLLAIKYDESIDNLSSLLQYASTEDKTRLTSVLANFNFDINTLMARGFARDLRNTIHYQDLKFDLSLLKGNTTREYIRAIYLSNSGVKTMGEFKLSALEMFNEMKILQNVIRKITSVDKTYSF